jgi:hypothetical protein
MAALAEIKDKLRRIEQELAEVVVEIEQLEALQGNIQQPTAQSALESPSAPEAATEVQWPEEIQWVDKEPLRQVFREMLREMGVDEIKPIGAEKLQQLMREDGIKAEDNILSRGIIEMREE